ncbi:ABC transporter substrate-binding protein [Caballeronia sp. LjRoot34]|uniref:ABC transporter substrate-binding protein n=1 Tax=Caballeronia sp. LjRoot34 TaxID=3342325 RepID=UPI003ED06122
MKPFSSLCSKLVQSLIVGASILFASHSFAQSAPVRGGSVVLALGADPAGLNPAVSTSGQDLMVGCILYQGLTTTTDKGDIRPMLAKSWSISPDGRTYTFELNSAKWQDGKPFTSEDVKYSLLEVNSKYSPVFAAAGRAIDSIDTPTPSRVVMHLKQPFGPLLISLSCSNGGAILPEHVFKGTNVSSNPATSSQPIGLGPFMFKEWVRGDHITLAKNPDYYEAGKPYLDQVIFRIIPQAASRTQALLAGDIDYTSYYYVSTNDYPVLKAAPNLRLVPAGLPPSINMLVFNVTRKPLDDKRVRQALTMATNRDFLQQTAFRNNGTVGTMPFPSKIAWAANPDIDYRKMYPFNVAKANALLDQAGLKRGPDGTRFKINILYQSDDQELPVAAVSLKNMWKDVGVDLTIIPVDFATSIPRMFKQRDFDTMMISYTSFGDPALGLARIFVTSAQGKTYGNSSGYSNKTVDDLFAQAEQATSEADRGALYKKVQMILADDLPMLTLNERGMYDAMSKSIKGTDGENYLISWRNAYLTKN